MPAKTIPLVSLVEGYGAYRAELDEAIRRVLESGWYILGREVEAFESEFAAWCRVGHCVGVASGTDAIVLALKALDVGSGDAVFTVSHTAVATVAAVELAGATPVLVDIDDTFTLDPAKLEQAITSTVRTGQVRPRAVIAVHLYGQACDLAAIRAVCRRHGLFLIEDCAQAHGATYEGKRVGAFGDISSFSFYPTKNLCAFGDGGAVVTPDPALAERVRALRQYGWRERYLSDVPGMNSRLDELQAAILRVRLRHLDDEIEARRRIAAAYDRGLGRFVGIPAVRAGTEHAYHLYVIRVHDRDGLALALADGGIGTGIHYPLPVHRQSAYAGRIAAPDGLAVTDRANAEILSLPMFPFLAEADVDRVVAAVVRKQGWNGP